jgi:transcriptional regulator GlxA family with amidase domain
MATFTGRKWRSRGNRLFRAKKDMVDFSLIAFEGGFSTGIATTLDILATAAQIAPTKGAPAPTWRVYSCSGGMVRLGSGMFVETQPLLKLACTDTSTWVIPGLAMSDEAEVLASADRNDMRLVSQAIAAHLQADGRVAAACSAVFLLHQAGVLADRKVTTSWWLAPLLQRLSPEARVDARRMVCVDGPITTGGAAFAQTDLMLHLLRHQCGSRVADAISRVLLIDAREAQGKYVVPEVLANGDELISRLVSRIERSLPEPPAVAALAREFCVSERTLSRYVQRVTGRSTLALVQTVKLRKARALLEQSRFSVDQIAEAVGYSDSTALRRLMKKVTGSSPSSYRTGRVKV